MVNTMVNTMVTANIIIDNNETILTKNIKLQNLIDTIIELESYEKNNLEYDEGCEFFSFELNEFKSYLVGMNIKSYIWDTETQIILLKNSII